jgi:hypothetical protein
MEIFITNSSYIQIILVSILNFLDGKSAYSFLSTCKSFYKLKSDFIKYCDGLLFLDLLNNRKKLGKRGTDLDFSSRLNQMMKDKKYSLMICSKCKLWFDKYHKSNLNAKNNIKTLVEWSTEKFNDIVMPSCHCFNCNLKYRSSFKVPVRKLTRMTREKKNNENLKPRLKKKQRIYL